MMTDEEVNELFKKYKETGDKQIRNKIFDNFYYIAEILAKRFVNRGVDYDDLRQVAAESLLQAVDKFDPTMGTKFATFVTPTITGCIRNYFRDNGQTIRVPRTVYALRGSINKYIADYTSQYGATPTMQQIADALGTSVERVLEATEYGKCISLDDTYETEDGSVEKYDALAKDESLYDVFENKETLRAEIAKLEPLEQEIVRLRYSEDLSQMETGKKLGISQMYVSRAERKILEKLRAALGGDDDYD